LIGDSVDNIPGVDKVGPKTAVKLLAQYGTLDNLIAHGDDIAGVVGENLRKVKDWLPQARKLITVKCDVPLDLEVEQLEPRDADKMTLARMFERFEFQSWRQELGDDIDVVPGSTRQREYEAVLTPEQLTRWLAKLEAASLTAIDVQTTTQDQLTAELVGLSFSIEPDKGAYIPLAHRYTGAPDQLDRNQTLARL
jgi:DNA polymerase-1